jgi:hypothetical protein
MNKAIRMEKFEALRGAITEESQIAPSYKRDTGIEACNDCAIDKGTLYFAWVLTY